MISACPNRYLTSGDVESFIGYIHFLLANDLYDNNRIGAQVFQAYELCG